MIEPIQIYTPQARRKKSFHPSNELTVSEMLDDPIVQDVMRSDRITKAEVFAAINRGTRGKLCLAA